MISLNATKWRIIEELSKGNKTPTELAKKLKISLPSIHAQLTGLEKEKIIKKVGKIKGKTRPYAEYSIEEGFVYFIKALPSETEQKFLAVDENLRLHLRIWSVPQKEYHYYIERFWWQIQDYLKDIDAIVVYGSVATGDAREGSDIDILMLVKKNIKKYEKMFSAKMIGTRGKRKMVMCQIFGTDDFENSFKKGSDFAQEVVKNNIVIYDPDKNFIKIKK